jgi:hypothetical protein
MRVRLVSGKGGNATAFPPFFRQRFFNVSSTAHGPAINSTTTHFHPDGYRHRRWLARRAERRRRNESAWRLAHAQERGFAPARGLESAPAREFEPSVVLELGRA